MRNFLHHLEYEHSGLNISNLKQIIKEKRIMYDHVADKKDITMGIIKIFIKNRFG